MLVSKILLVVSVTVGFVVGISTGVSANTAEKYQKVSAQLVAQANAVFSTQEYEGAKLLYERALVAAPANISALIGLGRTHEAEGDIGKGLKYYRQALEIEPNDKYALEVQTLAFLKRDMTDKADSNRDKLARLCAKGCAALDVVETAIEAYKVSKAAEAPSTAALAENNGS